MAWEKGNRLTMMNSAENSLLFGYDASGLRTWRIANEDYTEYTYIGTTLVSQNTNGEVINFSYTASGAPYGFTLNGTSYFYLLNLQGDVIGIYDSNGNIVVQYVYDSWGKLISITGSLADTVGVKNPLRYRGYYYDTLSGLYYLQSRYYDPETGRFISSDTLLIAGNDTIQGTNLFAYCYNNPIMYVDNFGTAPQFINFVRSVRNYVSNVFSIIPKDKLNATKYLNFALASIGAEFINAKVENIKISIRPSGVKNVIFIINGSLSKGDYNGKYEIDLYYGTGLEWLKEYQDYYTAFDYEAIIDYSVGLIPMIGNIYSTLKLILGFLIEDPYETILNDIFNKAIYDNSRTYYSINYIKIYSNNKMIYTCQGGWFV